MSPKCSALVVDVETDAIAVVFEIELIVVVVAAHLGWVERQRSGNVAVVHLQADGGILLGVQVVLRIDAVDRTFGMDVVTRLVDHSPQQPLFLRAGHIVRVVLRLEVHVAKLIVEALSQTLFFGNGIVFYAVSGDGLGIRLQRNSAKKD